MSGKFFPKHQSISQGDIFSLADLSGRELGGFAGLGSILDELVTKPTRPAKGESFLERMARGIAFVTFAYDIDGVTMEIAKYGEALNDLLARAGFDSTIHCIGGRFTEKADLVLDDRWERLVLDNADGWAKWDGGQWFSKLFHADLPEDSEESCELAFEVWRQATILAKRLCDYIEDHQIGLLFSVNVNSNPGNLAFALAIVLSSELSGCPVLNNSHDFYWEGGTPPSQRRDGEPPGPRDHFFRNFSNRAFFALFERILPWNGRKWVQVNINPLQSRHLVHDQGFLADNVFTIGTSIASEFFDDCSRTQKRENRRKMMRVFSGGGDAIETIAADAFLRDAGEWMADQKPVVCGSASGLGLDLSIPDSLYFLQPTRVIARKRIWRVWDLVRALLEFPEFRQAFDGNPRCTLTLHVTGPVPMEHQADLERVVRAYLELLADSPENCAQRLFLAFSAGHQMAPGLDSPLAIADIFKNADLVLLPSQTEGRGLPILEAAATGVPIMCSRYEPARVFEEVVGENLPVEQRIAFHEFPGSDFPRELLAKLTHDLLHPAEFAPTAQHNRSVIKQRYSHQRLRQSLADCLNRLEELSASGGSSQCTSVS